MFLHVPTCSYMFLLISSRSYRCPKPFTCDARWRPQRRHPWKALEDPKNRQVAEHQAPAANDPHDKNLLAEFHRIYVSIRKQPHCNTGNSKEDAEWNMHVGLYYTYNIGAEWCMQVCSTLKVCISHCHCSSPAPARTPAVRMWTPIDPSGSLCLTVFSSMWFHDLFWYAMSIIHE